MSGGKRGGGIGSSTASNGSIPSASKKIVQSLKEIVNCPEAEIYTMLKECNMDPNEAVNRLLSQDPFHEVKSKREKKKENKDVHDSRPRGSSGTSTRGGRGGVDRYSTRGSTSQFGHDSVASRGKPAYKKDNGPIPQTNSSVAAVGNNSHQRQPSVKDATTEKAFPTNTDENFPAALPSSGFQTAWGGMAGQVSLADIVKMGRPQHGKASSNYNMSQQHANNQYPAVSAARPQSNDLQPSHNYASNVSDMKPSESGISESHHLPPNDDWTLEEEPPATSISSVVEPSVESDLGGIPYDGANPQFRSQADEVRFVEGVDDKIHDSYVQSVPGANRSVQEESSASASGFDNDLHQNNLYQAQQDAEETSISVSSVTVNLQSMSLSKDDEDSPSEEDAPAVKIPDHLQVQSADCSHLSFGSFGSGMGAPFSAPFSSRPGTGNNEDTPAAADAVSVEHTEARDTEYYEDEHHLKTASDESTAHRMGTDSGNFDAPSVSQPDMLKQEAPEVTQENQYSFPSSTANYSFENSQQLNAAAFAQQQASSQIQGLPSGGMPYSNSLPSTLLASNMQPLREAELAYSPFPISQSMPTRHNNSASTISGPTASMAEAMKTSNFTAAQPTQNLPGSGVAGGPALPQQLLHPYSQPSVPMGHYASMLSYPFLPPQSYPYLPSAFQQAFAAGNSNFPQALAAAMLPQYKNSVSVSSMPQSAAVASGYGAFGNSNSVPSNFPLNHPTAPAGTSMSYDDLLSSQYKDASHLLSLQQGPGSRTMSGMPGSAYYNFQGQTHQQQPSQQQQQQPAGFRQTQPPSQHQQPTQQQHYGHLSGYPNFYHSQAAPTLEQQLQMSRDSSLGGPQGQPQKQTPQQLWQSGY